MANEIKFAARGLTGSNLYAVVLNSAGATWNGAAFETLEADNWTNYDIALTEQEAAGTKVGIWLGTFPVVSAGLHSVLVYQRAGADPAVSDVQVGQGGMDWSGTAEYSLGSTITSIAAAITSATATILAAISSGAVSAASIAAAVWAYATRTLTSSAAATAATVAGSTITITRGDSASIAITGLGNITGRSKLWVTVKRSMDDTDAEAVIQLTELGGLLILNGAAGTSGQGSITVSDEDDGDLTIALDEAATALLYVGGYVYDIQVLISGTVSTLTTGTFDVSGDVTRATS